MSNITLGQLGAVILGLAALIGAISAIVAVIIKLYGKTVGKSIENAIKPLREEIEKSHKEIRNDIEKIDISECRNFLVRFLGDIERGTDIDPVEIERAYDVMHHYSNEKELNQNSYVKSRWNAVIGDRAMSASIKKYSKNYNSEE